MKMNTGMMGSSSRLIRRLLIFAWAVIFVGAAGVKAAPVKTLVQDTLYRADGSTAQGNITIRWNAFSTSAGEAVAAGQMTVQTDANGGISIPLIPNTGASPSGSYYRVVMNLDDGTTSEEMWVVPATATTTVAAIRAKVVPQAVAAQFVSRDYVDSALAALPSANEVPSVLGYGAKCDGATDDSAAFTAADALGVSVLVPSGTAGACVIKSSIALNSQWIVNQGAKLSPGAGVTVTMAKAPQAGLYSIFSGAGQVQFSVPVTVYPEWWGAVPNLLPTSGTSYASDAYPALVSACNSLPMRTGQINYSGANARTGTIMFQPMYYTYSHPWTCSYGVAYTIGNTTGGTDGVAWLELEAGAVPTPPATETFAWFIDPPASSAGGAMEINEAFSTLIQGVKVVVDGNSSSSITNYVSGVFAPLVQGTSLSNFGAQKAWGRGCVLMAAPSSNNPNMMDCTDTFTGPNVTIAGEASFGFINTGGNNVSGTLGQVETTIPTGTGTVTYTIPYVGGFVSGSSRVQVMAAISGSPYINYPVMAFMQKVTTSPAVGQYEEGAGGVLTFNAAEEGLPIRIYYQDTSQILAPTTNSAVKPVPAIQVEANSDVHIDQVFCEGSYECLGTYKLLGLTIDQLEAHPAAVPSGAAAVVIDANSNNVLMPKQKYFFYGSGMWTYGLDDLKHGVQRTLVTDANSDSYARDYYSPGYLATAANASPQPSTPGLLYPDGVTITENSNGQISASGSFSSANVGPLGTATSSSGNYGSNPLTWAGSYWNGSAATPCTWTMAMTLGTGTSPASYLNITPSCGGSQYINYGTAQLIGTGTMNISGNLYAQTFMRGSGTGTVAVGAGAGTGGAAACVSGTSCLNNGGRILVTAGASGMAAGTQATFTFHNQFANIPVCPVTVNYNNSTATAFLAPGWSSTSTVLTLTLGNPLGAGQTVELDYQCW